MSWITLGYQETKKNDKPIKRNEMEKAKHSNTADYYFSSEIN